MPQAKRPPSTSTSKMKLSNSGGKPNVNLVSAQGEITSPKDFTSRRPSVTSPTPKPTSFLPGNAADDITLDPLYAAVQKLDPSLRNFLRHDWETNNSYKLTKLKYYEILHHFDSETKARPSHLMASLKKSFKDDLRPKLKRFCIPPPSNDSMETEEHGTHDFDPLHRTTTTAILVDTIEKKNPNVKVSRVALKDEVLVLYKHYVDNNLQLPRTCEYSKRPRIVHSNFVSKLNIQSLRHAIQSHHPEIFLNIPVLRLPNYVSIYRKFLIEEDPEPGEEQLVVGYHYWIIEDLLQDLAL